MYPEFMIAPMREELTRFGVRELKTAAEVDAAITETPGTTMVVVNSVCGCAAGKARPGVAQALQHGVKPDHVTSVFAGADTEATQRARGYFTGYPPSSPAIALLKDGKLDRPDEPKGPNKPRSVSGSAVPKAGKRFGGEGGTSPQGA